jgi:hypothetical protein
VWALSNNQYDGDCLFASFVRALSSLCCIFTQDTDATFIHVQVTDGSDPVSFVIVHYPSADW